MKIPRVHEVLDVLYPRGWECQEALQEGTDCHAITAEVLQTVMHGEWCPVTYDQIKKERVLRLLEWCQQQQLEPLQIEWRVASETYGYCGTLDFYGLRKKDHMICDWKYAETITEANYMQIEAYRRLVPGAKAALVQIPKTGPIKFIPCKPRADLWAAFLSGLQVWKWRNRNGQPSPTSE